MYQSAPRTASPNHAEFFRHQQADANGNGQLDADEHYDRSVPCRTTVTVPALSAENSALVLSDPVTDANGNPIWNIWTSGALTAQAAGLTAVNNLDGTGGTITVTSAGTSIGGGSGTQPISAPATPNPSSFTVTATADATGLAGLDNCATLVNPNGDDLVIVNDPLSLNQYTFTCQAGTNLKACAWPLFLGSSSGNGCTYTQGGWGADKVHGLNPAYYLNAGWSTAYPGGSVTVGGTNKMTFTSPKAVAAYLPAGGTPGALTVPLLTNPLTSSSGVFGGQVLALQLAVDFGNAGVGWATVSSVGGIKYNGTLCGETGRTVSQILGDANILLGGGTVSGCSIADMNTLVTSINEGFDQCQAVQPPFSN